MIDRHEDHAADWRVNPNQVIVAIGDQLRVRVVCAVCGKQDDKLTRRRDDVNPADPRSWRRWREDADDVR